MASKNDTSAISYPKTEEKWEDERMHPTVTYKKQTLGGIPVHYSKEYEFSDDFFSHALSTWKRVLTPLANKPNLRYLEIGAYEGRSLIWMLENVLTHPSSRLTGIDIFASPDIYKRYLSNIKKTGQAHRITTIKGYSQVELRRLPLETYDIIYIDGSHTADDVLADATLSWGLLKTGGLVLFDDYAFDGSYYAGPGNHLPVELLPVLGIRAFMQCYRNYFDVVHFGYQVILRKRNNPCPNKTYCSPIGQYIFNWKNKKLFREKDKTVVPVSRKEQELLRKILWRRRYIGTGYALEQSIKDNPEVRKLCRRLNLKL